jgi:hypothetical protein
MHLYMHTHSGSKRSHDTNGACKSYGECIIDGTQSVQPNVPNPVLYTVHSGMESPFYHVGSCDQPGEFGPVTQMVVDTVRVILQPN